ncbi:translation initiation factor IF-2-like [Canis lupus dingo]|uniref:translation initiation factor IF-2-like n=1 Tax=Canis lupus dingo TaxID=286419 RepID=UPI0020C28307|nr:translation initiation factor IF-2-like [Canis lupus dingo]
MWHRRRGAGPRAPEAGGGGGARRSARLPRPRVSAGARPGRPARGSCPRRVTCPPFRRLPPRPSRIGARHRAGEAPTKDGGPRSASSRGRITRDAAMRGVGGRGGGPDAAGEGGDPGPRVPERPRKDVAGGREFAPAPGPAGVTAGAWLAGGRVVPRAPKRQDESGAARENVPVASRRGTRGARGARFVPNASAPLTSTTFFMETIKPLGFVPRLRADGTRPPPPAPPILLQVRSSRRASRLGRLGPAPGAQDVSCKKGRTPQ